MIQTVNPSNNEVIKSYQEISDNKLQNTLEKMQFAFEEWKEKPFVFRSSLFRKAAEVLRKKREEYSQLMTLEMGKPIIQSRAEIDKCVWVCDYYADNAEKFLTDEIIKTDSTKSFVTYQPLGVILAVMPWNFPFWQVFRFAAPTLMAGNVGILKHASNVSGCSLAIEEVFTEAGFPEFVFKSVILNSSRVKDLISNPLIRAVSLTGSVPAGKSVASAAGSQIKKTVLELGGSDPYVVLEDADLSETVQNCVNSRLINGGQSCIAAKRFIVVKELYDKFTEMYVDFMKQKKMGDPFDETNDLGPQASVKLRDELHEQVLRSINAGAKLLLGGFIPNMKGAFYPPTVLSDVKPGMPAFDEELFGPVAAITKAENEDDAIRLANQTVFGLGAAVFTKDIKRGEKIAKEKLNAGSCFVNQFVRSDPRLPFGGIKESGYGRELSVFGIREFVNIKTVSVK
ncbi:NAD-dependent succinate-semialdehyde dehydrogenase [Ignavibacterium album JCM 16511]|uniref:NAD-dependent succinate-semialdehyde dehydrogenase n=1 Tax=Ignavibacterium album (strain DSM 19864 / JCM 16511 / NBRC 101810 / Mat9-16) TaxID=945713 RepID=I0ALU2_IGNAJ|nr:NAD-dependent succinate-semialdehyde dehydrogenase [Ignavibacterium album]AFH49949.1 NAD-dependent succinate-semialdehyde dehydrogenase [Ignavibacterium album JCM 16511]